MTKRWYAATLKGVEPKAIADVFAFDDYSQRKQWLIDWENYPAGERTPLKSSIAKKHFIYQVSFDKHIYMDGSVGWVWFYNNHPMVSDLPDADELIDDPDAWSEDNDFLYEDVV